MHILFLAPRFPLPAIKGDKLRAWQCIRALSKAHRVTLVTYVQDDDERDAVSELAAYCHVRAIPFSRAAQLARTASMVGSREPFQLGYYRSRGITQAIDELWPTVDAVHLNTVRMAGNLRETMTQPLVVDFIDALSLGTKRWAESRGGVVGRALGVESARLKGLETRLRDRAHRSFCVGEVDAAHIGGVEVLPHAVDMEHFRPDGDEYENGLVVLSGNFAYAPNVEAAVWFVRSIWPQISSAKPEARLRLMGANPAGAVRALAGSGAEVAGFVEDMAIELRRAHVAVAPLLSGAGAQTKVLEAMACGTPVVATSLANAAIGAEHGRDLLLADEPEAFASEVLRVIDDRTLRGNLSSAGNVYVDEQFSMTALESRILGVYKELDL